VLIFFFSSNDNNLEKFVSVCYIDQVFEFSVQHSFNQPRELKEHGVVTSGAAEK
jgi:hypothetical protein